MKKVFKFSVLVFISAALITVTSCSKDDDDDPTPAPPTEKSKLINRDFAITDYLVTLNGEVFQTFANLASCDKDDITKFLDDNSGIFDEGNTKCDPGDPQQTAFNWSFQSNDEKLKIESSGESTVYDIKINNGTTLKLEYSQVDDLNGDGQNDVVVASYTFTKQ